MGLRIGQPVLFDKVTVFLNADQAFGAIHG